MRMRLRNKTILLIAVISIALTIGSVVICYTRYTNRMLSTYKENAKQLATTTAMMVLEHDAKEIAARTLEVFEQVKDDFGGIPNLDEMSEAERDAYFARYDAIKESEDYKKMLEELRDITRINGALSVYFAAVDVESGIGIYVADGSNPEDTVVCELGEYAALEEGGVSQIVNKTYQFEVIDTNYPEYGWLCTAVDAVIDDGGDFVGLSQVDLSLYQIEQDRIGFLIRLLGVMLGFTILFVGFAAYVTNKYMVNPLKELAEATTSFVKDRDSESGCKLDAVNIKTGDEIEDLYHSFVDMENELSRYIDDLMKITAEKEKLGVELDLAKRIQASALPTIFPPFPDRKEFDIYATMDPAKEVGGDFYDFFLIDDDHIGLVMADVSGKGVPAALFMMISKTIIKTYTQAGGTMDTAEILRMVNEQLCANNEADMFVTVWLAIVTISTGAFISANAGHEYPAIRRAGGEFELIHDKHGLPLASMDGVKYRNYEDTLNKGDILFVYTDGVTEATSSENELFGNDRLIDALNGAKTDDCRELIDKVSASIDGFVKEAPQFDDITMLAFRYDGILN